VDGVQVAGREFAALLGHGVLVAWHLRNLRPLAGRRIEAMFLALAIEGSDAGPARVAARAVTHER
jgi:kynurenine formamidase